ncbi:MAG: adenosylcobinamide-GDP ribazoletransferase, partial [Polyangiaceae bacterium]
FPYRSDDWRWAPAHFPLVGLVLGALSAGLYALAYPLGPLLAALLSLALSIALSGALHEDGLADSADALGGAHERERVLAILKDSRIGTYGALALVLSVGLRASAIGQLQPPMAGTIVLVHCLARVGPVWLLATQPYVSSANSGKGAIFDGTGLGQALLASLYGLISLSLFSVAGWLHVRDALVLLAILALVTALLARYFKARVGGISGDLLGANEQIAELVCWVFLTATLR